MKNIKLKMIENVFPNKDFSQNFLLDLSVIQKIMTCLTPHKKHFFLEIGPGLGALTIPICNIVKNIAVIEIDMRMINILKKKLANYSVKFINANALYFNYFNLLNLNKNKLIRIIGNLPYNIATKLIFVLLDTIKIVYDMHFMLQYEVACRFFASPGTHFYSRISVIMQYYCDIKPLFIVDANSFFPVPKVKSYFIRLKKKKKQYPKVNIKMLNLVTKTAFSERRKYIKNSLSNLFSANTLCKLHIDPLLRPQNLSVVDYCRLAQYLDS
ncbi:Ribosomal RNA small subunit methyltransferase A [Buchnera aphidicola (Thelaxes suberi)]|uniref:16S rRNA (adenine(1518)-N(6)/adenine(1519)-N(6))- dimethyltransferase RsmA n=1 Tax=Buchnera aphidicola TaxID=9 RepID=UPI003463A2F7